MREKTAEVVLTTPNHRRDVDGVLGYWVRPGPAPSAAARVKQQTPAHRLSMPLRISKLEHAGGVSVLHKQINPLSGPSKELTKLSNMLKDCFTVH